MKNLQIALLTNKISKLFGLLAQKEFPPIVQNILNNLYVKITGVDLSEFHSAKYYKSLNALFTRELLKPREFSNDSKDIISPSDSLISEFGDLHDNRALQIKGFGYSVDELLTTHIQEENLNKIKNGKFINFYLSPKDYHRYHVALNMKVTKAIHVPGLLYPVNFKYLKKVQNLFVKNERVILECFSDEGRVFYMILVGALNVGKMTLSFDDRIETNSDTKKIQVYEYEDLYLQKGDELGMFKMGSTVVMIFEKDFVKLKCKLMQKVSFGDTIATKV